MSHSSSADPELPTGGQAPRAAVPEGSAPPPGAPAVNPKRAVPILLGLFVFSLIIDNGFKYMSLPIAEDLNLSIDTVSLQATLAGVIIGIGAVVYSTLADSVSIRRLLILAIIMMAVGSIIGFVGQASFGWILAGRIIQTAGLAAAETLYVIYVTKYLSKRDQKTYLGFSTSAFQLSMLVGVVGSGFIATYIGWTALFLVTLVAVIALPAVIKYVPKDQAVASHLDIFGLFLIGIIATGTMIFMQDFNWVWLAPVAVAVALFVWHIRTNPKALVPSEFFRYKPYVFILITVFILYTVQLGFSFLFPFLAADLHGYNVAESSLLLAPGYATAAVVGALTGKIAKYLDSKQAITVAILTIIGALLLAAAFTEQWIGVYVIAMILFSSGFALMYAPMLNTAVGEIPAEKTGVAIGFYNLTINIAVPIGIAYTAALAAADASFLSGLSAAPSETGGSYATILYVLAGIAVVSFVLYRVFAAILERHGYDTRQAFEAEAEADVETEA